MSPEEHLRAGDLAGALSALQDRVRADAANPKLRVFLFQLLCVMGDWKRAITQLKVCGEMQASALPMAQAYREAIICEVFRDKVFLGEKDPLLFGEPQDWVAKLVEAAKLLGKGKPAEAAKLREQAFEEAPASDGMLNGEPFEWIADADMRLGPVVEMIINGKYFWVPFSAIRRLDIDPPTDLRDTVWMPAQLTVASGGQMVCLLPARYPGTAERGSDAEKLGRATSWADAGAETFVGTGQKLWATEAGDVALMEARALTIGPAEDAGDGATDG